MQSDKQQRNAEQNAENAEKAHYVPSVPGIVGAYFLRQAEYIAEQNIRKQRPEKQKIHHQDKLLNPVFQLVFHYQGKSRDIRKQHNQPNDDKQHADDLRENVLASETRQRPVCSARI